MPTIEQLNRNWMADQVLKLNQSEYNVRGSSMANSGNNNRRFTGKRIGVFIEDHRGVVEIARLDMDDITLIVPDWFFEEGNG